uniref:Phospholipid/glycerol acyltransferase domain-containing protein n=1 Tax=Panagrolaimus sp. JU765 TaxID=591449 RepID=A0AC34RF84_9BILA
MSTLGKTVNDGYEEWLGQIDAIGGELAWIRKSKSFPKKPVGNERSWTEINDSVLKSQPVQDAIAAEAERRRCSKKEVYLEAKEIVSNMAQEFSLPAVKVIGYGVVKVIKKLFDAIYVNLDQLRSLKAKVATNSVVLMPTHKTYVDFLLLSLLCYHEDVTLPAIAAGSDFQQSKIMGEALRRCGAFFMRRSFGKDQLYWAIFSDGILH